MKNKIVIGNDWDNLLNDEFHKPYFEQLMAFIEQEYQTYNVYPHYENIFEALKITSYEDVKVVILGQDPYHQVNQAHGLCFSVPVGENIPKSLHNIYLEIVNDCNIKYPSHGNLTSWAKQGVLLLNTVLTVRDSLPGSHRNIGWEKFTDYIITVLNKKERPVVFLLWGNDAKAKAALINNKIHKILSTVHPSPLSAHRGFFGCRHFSQTNKILTDNNLEPINWQI